jgi:hypothetical protein
MHFEILIEDSSGTCLLEHLLPKFLGPPNQPHTWRLHAYRGIGRIPKNLAQAPDPSRRLLLTKLPSLLRGYAKTPGYGAIVIVCDTDNRNCAAFLKELRGVAKSSGADAITMFRLAIEETEAWYLGDRAAVLQAYPTAKKALFDGYVQDAVCGTWERLADIVHPGGSRTVIKSEWPAAGDVKHQWANRIGPLMDPDRNRSPSFRKLRDGVRRLAATDACYLS